MRLCAYTQIIIVIQVNSHNNMYEGRRAAYLRRVGDSQVEVGDRSQ